MGHYRLSPMASRTRYPFTFVSGLSEGGGGPGGGGGWTYTLRVISIDGGEEVARVPGFTVDFSNDGSGQSYWGLVTDQNGEVLIPNIEPGEYTLIYQPPPGPPYYTGNLNEFVTILAADFTKILYMYPTSET